MEEKTRSGIQKIIFSYIFLLVSHSMETYNVRKMRLKGEWGGAKLKRMRRDGADDEAIRRN